MYLFAACSENYCIWSSCVIFTALPEASKDIQLVTQMQRMSLLAGQLSELDPAFAIKEKYTPPMGTLTILKGK